MAPEEPIEIKNIDQREIEGGGGSRVVLSPRLQMIKRATFGVAAQRAELCGSVRIEPDSKELSKHRLVRTGAQVRVAEPDDLDQADIDMPPIEKGVEGPDDTVFSVFVHTDIARDQADVVAKVSELAVRTNARGDVMAVEIRARDLGKLAAIGGINYIEVGSTVAAPQPIVEGAGDRPDEDQRRIKRLASEHRYGFDVLVGIVDVEGFDFAHPDFLHEVDGVDETRFVAIWDQTETPARRPAPSDRHEGNTEFSPFSYGSEITADEMNAAIAASNAPRNADGSRPTGSGIPATRLEPQSIMVPGSHGTHVASIAAGRFGVARQASIAGVTLALGSDETDRRLSLYDSTRLVDAIDYLFALGKDLDMPVSVNVSLSTNGHAHDASSALSRRIDYALTRPGRSVCVSAGNAGQTDAQNDDDIGFVMGRVHAADRIGASGLSAELGWRVVGGQVVDLSENELEIWYAAQDRISVSVRPPGGDWIGPIGPGQRLRNHRLASLTMLSIFNETYHPANGANRIAVFLSPFFSSRDGGTVVPVQGGEWKVRLTGDEIRDGRFHGWIERDDPAPLGTNPGGPAPWRFPSFFSPGSYVDDGTIGSLACGQRIIAVANVDGRNQTVNPTSSRGPTRDDRDKPDLGAPGTEIVAANGFSPDGPWVSMTGTSMASPWVAGLVALMLAMDHDLTAAQIGAMLRRGATPLPGHAFAWRRDAGFGVAGGQASVDEVLEHRRLRRNP